MTPTKTIYSTTSALGLLVMTGTTAVADVTAQDVWANMSAAVTASGGTMSGDLNRSGDITTVSGVRYDFALPMGVGTFGVGLPDFAMIENGDGSVLIDNLEDSLISVDGTLDGSSFSTTVRMNVSEWNTLATGDPGSVTYTGSSTFTELALESLTLDGQSAPDMDFQFRSDSAQGGGTFVITEGELVTITFDIETNDGESSFMMTDPFGTITQSAGTTGTTTIAGEVVLPAGGSTLLNLAPAFAQGLAVDMTFNSSGGENSQTTTDSGGQQLSSQSTTQGASAGRFRLDADGLFADARGENITLEMNDQVIPVPVNLDLAEMSIKYLIPLTAREEDQEFGFELQLDTLRLGPSIWDLVDPGKQLDRTPLDISLDMGGAGVLNTDVTNFLAFGDVIDSGGTPFMPSTFELRELSVAALGADANATAAIIFDATDLTTYFGFPKPVGGASFTINGLNAAMDQLTALGVIGPDEMFGVNMMIGMIANATGDDQLSGTLELGEDGSISANGQRLR